MKTILLTSSGTFTTDKKLEFLSKPLNEMKMAWVITASKGVDDTSYIQRHKQRMDELGFDYEEIDIEGKNEKELREILNDKEVVFVEGGNTFYLLKCVRESGFDKVIKELIEKGVIYIGASAGSYIACPTIEMATWRHQDEYDRCGVTNFTGLNLVSFLVIAHYAEEYKEIIKEGISKTKYPVRILTDDQALLVRDDEVELVGKGPEIKL